MALMEFVDEKFNFAAVSHLDPLSPRDTRSALIATLGADFQQAVAPYKNEILSIAAHLRGDLHRAAMRLLVERNGRRPSTMEQQLIVAALAELQESGGRSGDILGRVAERLNLICETLPAGMPPRAGARAADRPPTATPAPVIGCAGDARGP